MSALVILDAPPSSGTPAWWWAPWNPGAWGGGLRCRVRSMVDLTLPHCGQTPAYTVYDATWAGEPTEWYVCTGHAPLAAADGNAIVRGYWQVDLAPWTAPCPVCGALGQRYWLPSLSGLCADCLERACSVLESAPAMPGREIIARLRAHLGAP